MLQNFREGFKKNIYSGALVALPVVGTVWFVSWLVGFFDNIVLKALPADAVWCHYLFQYPGYGVLATVLFLLALGFVARTFLGSKIVEWSTRLLERLPLIGSVYASGQKIVRAIVPNKYGDLRKVAILEYPGPGLWCICFVTGDALPHVSRALEKKDEEAMVSVFIPTAPNPTSGMLIMVPLSRLTILDLPADEGMRYIITAGIGDRKDKGAC